MNLATMRTLLGLSILLALSPSASSRDDRANIFPKLRPGATLTYLIQFRSDKLVRPESRVVSPVGPDDSQVQSRGLLRIEILDARPQGTKAIIRARSEFRTLGSGLGLQSNDPQLTPPASPAPKHVEFTLLADGTLHDIEGLDSLFPEQQQLWQQWAQQFAIGGVLPSDFLKLGQKWKSQQPERSASLIAALIWNKRGAYVRNEPCGPVQLSAAGEPAISGQTPEPCAVLLIHSTLQQKSSPKDATPEDFKLQGLRTSGTAGGTNEAIIYVSLTTGLVVRATEDAHQSMDVQVTKVAAANYVRYHIDAKSHSEVLLVAESSLAKP
ncbi:MAG: hypothetical protein NVS9B4_27440 [Candidatus Acidiferrum sp.]